MTENISLIDDILSLTSRAEELLQQRTYDEDRFLTLITTLHERMGRSGLFKVVRDDLITAIRDDKIDTVTRVMESLILPFAHETRDSYWNPVEESYRALFRLTTIRSNQHSVKGYEMLDRDPKLLKQFSDELRILTAVHYQSVSIEARARVTCRSQNYAVLLTYNTPLYLLFKERPEDIDLIVQLIRSEGETDGDRIAGMIDSSHVSLASGYL